MFLEKRGPGNTKEEEDKTEEIANILAKRLQAIKEQRIRAKYFDQSSAINELLRDGSEKLRQL